MHSLPLPLHLRVLSRFQRRPRPPSIAKETGEDPAAQPGQVSRPTWLTCGASSYRLARPSPAHPPSGSGYLRKLTRLEVEAERNWETPRPLPRRTQRLLGRVCRCGLRSLFSTGAGGCEAGREGAEHVLPPGLRSASRLEGGERRLFTPHPFPPAGAASPPQPDLGGGGVGFSRRRRKQPRCPAAAAPARAGRATSAGAGGTGL